MTVSANSTEFVVQDAFDPAKCEPFILGRVQWVRRSGDGQRPALSADFWQVTTEEAPEPFDLLIEADERFTLLRATCTSKL